MNNIAVYAGTFDPFTTGHLHILDQASPMFERIILAIGENPAKKTMFTLDQRLTMLQEVAETYPNVKCASFQNEYLVNYARNQGAMFIIRGLRNATDFEYELSMAQINQKISPAIRSVFFMADRQYADISSSMVKGLIGPDRWEYLVSQYLPEEMFSTFLKFTSERP